MNNTKLVADISKAMAALNMSTYDLAAIARISVSPVYHLLKGEVPSAPNTYARVIDVLGARINQNLFLKALKTKKESLGISTIDLAKLAGVSHRTLYRIESEGVMPSTKTCCKIIKKLELPLDKLIDWVNK